MFLPYDASSLYFYIISSNSTPLHFSSYLCQLHFLNSCSCLKRIALPVIDFRLLVLMAEEAEPVQGEVPGTPVVTKAELEPPHTPVKKPATAMPLDSTPRAHAKGSPKAKAKGSPKAKAKGSPKSKPGVKKPMFKKPAAKKLPGKNEKKQADEKESKETVTPAKTDKNKRKRRAAQKAAEKKEEEKQKVPKTAKTGTMKKPAASGSKAGKSSGTWKKGIEKQQEKEEKEEKEDKEDPEEEGHGFEDDAFLLL